MSPEPGSAEVETGLDKADERTFPLTALSYLAAGFLPFSHLFLLNLPLMLRPYGDYFRGTTGYRINFDYFQMHTCSAFWGTFSKTKQ